ncbi:MAG: SRPBCC family protein [Flavobacteriales bacterium]
MRVHVLERKQWLPIPLSEAWAFFSAPRNLGRITPPEMRFGNDPNLADVPVHEGERLTFTVRPLFGIAVGWRSLITAVDPPNRFVDKQLKGPFALWEHTHTFQPENEGTVVHDHLRYAMPLGMFGELVHALLVRKRVEAIFAYRQEALARLFPSKAR